MYCHKMREMNLIFHFSHGIDFYVSINLMTLSNRHALHFLSFQRLLNLPLLPFQVILFLIQTIALFAEFFHAFQLRPHSLSAIRLYLLIFPSQIADCIVVFLYLFRQAYPVYQILHFLVRFVKICFCHNFVLGVSLTVLPVLMPLTVPLSTTPIPCLNGAPNIPNQTLFSAIVLWCRSAP